MEGMTKKDIYNNSVRDLRTYVNGEIAMRPYYYYRNRYLHIRYTVDRCIELSDAEIEKLKAEMSTVNNDKQTVLAKAWNFFTTCVNKPIINDGIKAFERRMNTFKENVENGFKNKSSAI